jgi:hypothetical protein
VAAGAAVAAVLAGVLAVVITEDDNASSTAATTSTTESAPGAPVDEAAQAFTIALTQLEDAGSFSYEGWVHADAATDLRPTTVFVEPVAVDGEVDLPRRVHEQATDSTDAVHETVIVGTGSWERTGSAAYSDGQRGSLDQGAALLPDWLRNATDLTVVDDATARRLGAGADLQVFGAVVVLPEIDGPLPIYIALDADDVLTHVWIASAEAPFFVDWEITGIGDEVVVDAPGPLPDAEVDVSNDDVVAAGISEPVQLTEVPEGWVLAHVELADVTAGCPTLHLEYRPVDALRHPSAELDVSNAGCATIPGHTDATQDLTIGTWSGHITTTGEASTEGAVTSGNTTVVFHADLSAPSPPSTPPANAPRSTSADRSLSAPLGRAIQHHVPVPERGRADQLQPHPLGESGELRHATAQQDRVDHHPQLSGAPLGLKRHPSDGSPAILCRMSRPLRGRGLNRST